MKADGAERTSLPLVVPSVWRLKKMNVAIWFHHVMAADTNLIAGDQSALLLSAPESICCTHAGQYTAVSD